MTLRILVAGFSFLVALIAVVLIPAAYYGDKNKVWTKRLIVISGIAATIFLVDLLCWLL
jgi:hypothetical protein